MNVPLSEARLESMIDDLLPGLRADFDQNLRTRLVAAMAAIESLAEFAQPDDLAQLRNAAARMLLELLGVRDADIERVKTQLAGMDPATLSRRN